MCPGLVLGTEVHLESAESALEEPERRGELQSKFYDREPYVNNDLCTLILRPANAMQMIDDELVMTKQ